MTLLRFLHVVGIVLWLGGAVAAMALSMFSRSETAPVRAGVFRLLGRLHALVVAPGVLLTIASGLAIMMMLATAGHGTRLGQPEISAMMALGLVAGLVALFGAFPASQKAAVLADVSESGEPPEAFHRFRRRVAISSSIAGVLAVAALYFGVAAT